MSEITYYPDGKFHIIKIQEGFSDLYHITEFYPNQTKRVRGFLKNG